MQAKKARHKTVRFEEIRKVTDRQRIVKTKESLMTLFLASAFRAPQRVTTLAALVLFSLLASGTAPAQAKPAGKAKRVVIVSWDGAANGIVTRLLAQGKLPNVARLAKSGVQAAYSTPAFPSKTACGHAALWTGAYGDVNGVTGNSVPLLPRADHTLLESGSGFLSSALRAEPLYVTAARAGKKVLILSATQSFPPDPWVQKLKESGAREDRLITFDGFESGIAGEKIWDGTEFAAASEDRTLPAHDGAIKSFAFTIGDSRFTATVFDDPRDPVKGFDSLQIKGEEGAVSAMLKPAGAAETTNHFSPRFPVTATDKMKGTLFGYTYFRLFDLDPVSGKMTFFQRGVNGIRGTASEQERRDYLAAYGGFHSVPFDPYKKGALGKTLWQGGDGEAERRLLETARLDTEFLARGSRYALKRYKPDLVFHYTPMIDAAGHAWMGALDPDSPVYNPVLAARLMPFYEQFYQLQDAWLGDLIDSAGPDAAVCLVSDHGMAGTGNNFSPNAVLEKAGLLTRTADGKGIDLTKTQICAPPWGDYFVSVNGTDWKDGIVTPAERESVLRQASDALLSARDPRTGRPIVTRVFRPDEVIGLGMGGPAGGDLYLDFAPGFAPRNSLQTDWVSADPSPIGAGTHGFFPLRTKMQAIFFLGGAGVTHDTQIPGMRQIDVAPTIARLLGIPAPANATGHILGEGYRRVFYLTRISCSVPEESVLDAPLTSTRRLYDSSEVRSFGNSNV
jgi:predicted AlkP superfamily pyrophosphatase or phosphodiesterase